MANPIEKVILVGHLFSEIVADKEVAINMVKEVYPKATSDSSKEVWMFRGRVVAVLKRVPSDYEPCGECGFDHSYEQNEAANWHLTQLGE